MKDEGAQGARRVARALRRPGATANAELAAEWDLAWGDPGRPLPGMADALPTTSTSRRSRRAPPAARSMAAFEPFTPTMVGGAADLTESTKTDLPGVRAASRPRRPGATSSSACASTRMGGAVNGMAAHGGIVRPYGSTFLQFADYMRGSIRLSALMGLHVAWVFTHDSVGARRGRPDPPAGRAPRRAARDPRPRRAAPGRRARDGRGVARDPRGPRGPGRARPARARTCRCSTATSGEYAPASGVAQGRLRARRTPTTREAIDRRHGQRGRGRARRRAS